MINDSFNNLNQSINNAVSKMAEDSEAKLRDVVDSLEVQINDILANKEEEIVSRITSYETELRDKQESSFENIKNELSDLYNEFKDKIDYNGLMDISEKLEAIENSVAEVNGQLETQARFVSDRMDLEKEELYNSISKLSGEFEDLKSNIDERFKAQVNDFISNNEHILSLFGKYSQKISSVTDILEDIENVKLSLIDEINNVKEEIDNKYFTLSKDFDKSIDEIKDAVLDKNNMLQYSINEKELLIKEVEALKASFESLKDDILTAADEKVPTLLDSEKARIQSSIDDVMETLTARMHNNEDSILNLESSLAEYKSMISNAIDDFKNEVMSIRDNHNYSDLIEERDRLEESFNTLKEDFSKIGDLEDDLSAIKDKVKGVDTSINDEVVRLSEELEELKNNMANMEIISSVNNSEEVSDEVITHEDMNIIYDNFKQLSDSFEELKEDIIPQLSNFTKLEDKILESKEEIFREFNNMMNSLPKTYINKDELSRLEGRLDNIFNNFDASVVSIKDDLLRSIEKDSKEFKNRLEKRVEYFEDVWSDENKVVERSNNFHKDRVIPESPTHKDYAKTGYDRGHMAPAGDMRWSPEAMSDSFLMTNMSPQHPRCNRATWKYLEEQVREWAKNEKELYVICGPIFAEKSITICNGTIPVPLAYFKIVYDATPPEKMIAFIIPNWKTKGNLQNFTVTVEQVEKITGFNFFSNLPEETQLKLEATVSVDAWSWRTPFNSKSGA